MNKKLKTTLVILYFFAFEILKYIPFIVLDINLDALPSTLYNVYSISTEIILIATLIFIYYKDIKIYIEDFKKNGISHLKFGFNIWFKGLAVMIISNIIISYISPIDVPENEQAIRSAIDISPTLIALSTVLIAPVVEEILFCKTLFDIIKNKNVYIIVSGLIFGSFHIIGIGESLFSWLYVIPYAALGVSFAYIYVKTNNLLTSICLHSFHNLITVIQILLLL
jgi:membrane protease YdiL (CAAX protease family)